MGFFRAKQRRAEGRSNRLSGDGGWGAERQCQADDYCQSRVWGEIDILRNVDPVEYSMCCGKGVVEVGQHEL